MHRYHNMLKEILIKSDFLFFPLDTKFPPLHKVYVRILGSRTVRCSVLGDRVTELYAARVRVGFWSPGPWSVFSPLVHSMWGMDKQSSELSSQVSSLAANLRWTATTSVCVCEMSWPCLDGAKKVHFAFWRASVSSVTHTCSVCCRKDDRVLIKKKILQTRIVGSMM